MFLFAEEKQSGDDGGEDKGEGADGGGSADGGGDGATDTVKDKVTEVAEPVVSQQTLDWAGANWEAIGIAFAAAFLLYMLMRWMRHRLKVAGDQALEAGIVHHRGLTSLPRRVISQTNGFFLFTAALRIAVYLTEAPDGITQFSQLIFQIASIIQVAAWITSLILAIVDQRIAMLESKRAERLKNARELIAFLVKALLYSLAFIAVLEALDINATALIAGLGIGTIAVGLAAQSIFSDLFAALSIIVDRPFMVGDKIEFDGLRGYVKKTGLQTTILTTNNGDELIISNANLVDKTIINWSRAAKKRSRLEIDLDAGTPMEIMRDIPNMLEQIVTKRGLDYVRSGFDSFSSGGLRFKLVYDSQTEDYNQVIDERHKIGLDIIEALHEKGVQFDFEAPELLAVDEKGHKKLMPSGDDSGDTVMGDSPTD